VTTAAIERLRRRNEGLWTRSERAIAALARSFNPETLQRLTMLFASDIAAPVIRRPGKRHIIARENPKDVLAWAIGQRVRAAREGKNWRQEDLARESGIARANVARLETGRVVPKLPTLERAARALGIRIDALLKAPASAQDQEERFLAESGIGEWDEKLEAADKAQ
jgi:transcriptional regulator with XRE-family HTH domain